MTASDPYRPFRDIIAEKARLHPEKPYVVAVDQEKSLTYGELGRLANRMAHFFRTQGLAANDRVLLLAENSIEGMVAYLGTLRYGATLCTVNVELNEAHLAEIIRSLAPRLVLAQAGLGLERYQSETSALWRELGAWSPDGAPTGFFAEIGDLPAEDDIAPVHGRDDFAVIFYTSGTVAKPKGVIYSYATLFYNFVAVAEMVGLGADDRLLDFRSHSWISAQEMGLGGPLTSGATIIMAKRFSQSRYFDWIKTHRATIGVCVPTGINMLLNKPHDVHGRDMPHLRFMTSSSAPLLVEQWKAFEAQYGIRVAQGYGASECGWMTGIDGPRRRYGTAGKPLIFQRIRIVDDEGRALPQGAIGEIEAGGGKQQSFGYLLPGGAIEKMPLGAIRTGDLGFFDEDGYLHVTGRVKELIIRGGVNIAPLEIDGVLAEHPDVGEAMTLGVPDPIWGEEVVAFVAPKPGGALDIAAILAHCAARLPEFKRPKQIYSRPALPKTARGKLDRNALVEEWMRLHTSAR